MKVPAVPWMAVRQQNPPPPCLPVTPFRFAAVPGADSEQSATAGALGYLEDAVPPTSGCADRKGVPPHKVPCPTTQQKRGRAGKECSSFGLLCGLTFLCCFSLEA